MSRSPAEVDVDASMWVNEGSYTKSSHSVQKIAPDFESAPFVAMEVGVQENESGGA